MGSGNEQSVISVTIVEKKTFFEQKKLRKTEAPSKLLKQPSQISISPFAQSLAGKLNHLDAMGIHEKVKVDAEIKSRVTKTIQKAKIVESFTKLGLVGKEMESEPVEVGTQVEEETEEAQGEESRKKGRRKTRVGDKNERTFEVGNTSKSEKNKLSVPESHRGAKAGGKSKGSSQKGSKKKSKLVSFEDDDGATQDEGKSAAEAAKQAEQTAEQKVDWRKVNPGWCFFYYSITKGVILI